MQYMFITTRRHFLKDNPTSIQAKRKEFMQNRKQSNRGILQNIFDNDGLRFDYWIKQYPELKTFKGVSKM